MAEWIPVTERLPEPKVTIGEHVFSVDVLGTEGFTFRRAYYNYTAKVWLDGNEEQEWPKITHWMPLPEPPEGGVMTDEHTDPRRFDAEKQGNGVGFASKRQLC